MTYKETLHQARINNIDTGVLSIADEVDALNLNLNNEDFEEVCSFLYDIYLHYEEYSAAELATAFEVIRTNNQPDIHKICDMSKRDFIELGIRYI